MNRILLRALVALAAAWLFACNSIAPRPKPTDKPSPLTNVSSGGEAEASASAPRFGDITVRDSTSTTQTMRTTVMGDGDHVPHHIPTDTAGDTLNFYTEDAAVTEGGTGIGILARRNDALATTTSTDGDMTYLSASLSGELLTLDETVLAAIQLMHNEIAPALSAEDSAYAEGSIGMTILGVRRDTPTTSAGADGDNAAFSLNPSGRVYTTATIEAGTANIGDVDVLSLVPGTSGASLGKAEDAVHVSGDTGVLMLGVRRDTPSAGGASDGENTALSLTNFGELQTYDLGANALLSTINTSLTQSTSSTLAAINTSSDTTTSTIDVSRYDEVWIQVEFSATATGTIEVWGALFSSDLSTLTSQRGVPLYDVLEVGTACSHADGDRLVTIAYTSGSGNAVCSWRIPGPPPFLAVRWDQATGGGASGLAVSYFAR